MLDFVMKDFKVLVWIYTVSCPAYYNVVNKSTGKQNKTNNVRNASQEKKTKQAKQKHTRTEKLI